MQTGKVPTEAPYKVGSGGGGFGMTHVYFFSVGKRFGRGDHREWKSRIRNRKKISVITKVPRSTATLWEAPAGPPAKAKYFQWPIVNKYREGTVKSTPQGEWNSTWNHLLTSRQSLSFGQGDQRVIFKFKSQNAKVKSTSKNLKVSNILFETFYFWVAILSFDFSLLTSSLVFLSEGWVMSCLLKNELVSFCSSQA